MRKYPQEIEEETRWTLEWIGYRPQPPFRILDDALRSKATRPVIPAENAT